MRCDGVVIQLGSARWSHEVREESETGRILVAFSTSRGIDVSDTHVELDEHDSRWEGFAGRLLAEWRERCEKSE